MSRHIYRGSQKNIPIIGWMAFLLAVWLIASSPSQRATAQIQDNRWSQPRQISSPDKNADEGFLVSDPYGGIHLFWIERLIGGGSPVIQYAHLDERGWSQPVDVYTVSQGGELESLSVAVDPQGELHLAWTEGGYFRQRPVYYTHAPASAAGSARNWAEPQRIRVPANLICLQAGPAGEVHLTYSKFYEPQTGIYSTQLTEDGTSWTEPEWLDPDIPLGHTPNTLECASNGLGDYHLVWSYVSAEGVTDWIRYAAYRSPGGWSLPFTMDQDVDNSERLRIASPRIAASDQTVHVVWAPIEERLHRYSTDGGLTWSVPTTFMKGLDGQAFDGIAIDGTGSVHYLSQMRFPRAIYHTRWLGDHWDIPSLVYLISLDSEDLIGSRIHAHNLRAAFRMGNQLVVVFLDPPAEPARRLFVIQRDFTDIPASPVLNTPTPEVMDTSTPAPAAPGTTLLQPPAVMGTATPTRPIAALNTSPDGTQDPSLALMAGGIAASLLLILITVVYLLRSQIKHI